MLSNTRYKKHKNIIKLKKWKNRKSQPSKYIPLFRNKCMRVCQNIISLNFLFLKLYPVFAIMCDSAEGGCGIGIRIKN